MLWRGVGELMAYECCAVFGGYVLLWVGAVVARRDPEAVYQLGLNWVTLSGGEEKGVVRKRQCIRMHRSHVITMLRRRLILRRLNAWWCRQHPQ